MKIIRNNPLNIEKSTGRRPWKGELNPHNNKDRLARFISVYYGIRAAKRILYDSYYQKLGLKTVAAIINRWAPPGENPTTTYAAYVAKRMGVGVDDELRLDCGDMTLLAKMIHAMAKFEATEPVDYDHIREYLKSCWYD